MASLGDLIVRVGANVGDFDDAMAALGRSLEDAAAKTERVYIGVDKIGSRLAELGALTTATLTAPLVALGAAAIDAGGKMEQARVAFTTMLGSGAAATNMLKDLQTFAQSTPFEFPQLVDLSRRLLAFGFAAKDLIPTLTSIGNAVAAMGGGAELIDRVTLAFGEMLSKGQVSAKEMKQLAQAGIPAWDILANKIGVSIPEAMKQAEKGIITAADAIPALLAGLNDKFAGMMDAQSKTLLGMWSNTKDRISALLINIGDALSPLGKATLTALDPVLKFAQDATVAFGKLPVPIQAAALALAGLAVSIGPIILGTGLLLKSFVLIQTTIPVLVAGFAGLSAGLAEFGTSTLPIIGAAFVELATTSIPAAIAGIGAFSTSLITGAAAAVFDFGVTAIPAAIAAMASFGTAIAAGTSALATFATTGIGAALRGLAGLVSGGIMAAIEGIGPLVASAIPALTGALSALGVAATLAAGAFAGWKLGEWLYDNVPALKAFGDGVADLILKIPGLVSLINWMNGATAAQQRAATDLDGAIVKLQASLQRQGIDIKQGTLTNEQYAAKLRDAAKAVDGVGMAAYLAGIKLGSNAAEVKKNQLAYEQAVTVWKEAKKQLDMGQGSAAAVALAFQQMKAAAALAHPELQGTGSSVHYVDEQLKALQAQLGNKSIPMKLLEIADLKRRIFAPTETDNMTQDLALLEKKIELNRKASIPTSDVDLNKAAELKKNLMLAGMDTQQGFSLLGVTSSADLEREVQLVQAAYLKIENSAFASSEDIARAQLAAAEKTIQAWRTAGHDVPDSLILMAEQAKSAWEALHMDLGQALAKLGVESEAQLANALKVQDAALAKIRQSVVAGTATQLDSDNAEIASLEKKAADFKKVGLKMNDDEVERLAQLKAIHDDATRTLAGSFQFFGVMSDADLKRSIDSIKSAYQQIIDAESTTEDQANLARIAALQKMIADYKKAGKQVTDDMEDELARRTEDARQAALTIQSAFSHIGVQSFRDATIGLDGLIADFQKLSDGVSVTARDLDNAFVAVGEKALKFARDTGAAIPEALGGSLNELVHRIEDAKQRIALISLDIGTAFQAIGVQSTKSIVEQSEKVTAALNIINADVLSSTRDRVQAQIAAEEAYYNAVVAQGGKLNELDVFNTAERKARLKDELDYSLNKWNQLDQVFKTSFNSIRDGFVDAITGAKSFGDAFLDVAKSVEKAIVKYIIDNFVLSNKLISQISTNLTNLVARLGSNAATSAAGAAGEQLSSGTVSFPYLTSGTTPAATPTDAAAGASSAAGGGLSSILGFASLGVSIVSGIVSGIQGAHANSLLDKIEKSTRRTDITLEGQDGVNDHVRATHWNTAGLWTDLGSSGWFHDAFASLMSTTEGILGQLKTMALAGVTPPSGGTPPTGGTPPGGGTMTPPAEDTSSDEAVTLNPRLDQSIQDLADFTGTLKTSVSTFGGAVGSTVQPVNDLATAADSLSTAIVTTDGATADLGNQIDDLLAHLGDLEKAHKVNSDDWDATKTQLIDLTRQQAELNKVLAAQGKAVNDLSGDLLAGFESTAPVVVGISQDVLDSLSALSTAVKGFQGDAFDAAVAISAAGAAIGEAGKPSGFSSELFGPSAQTIRSLTTTDVAGQPPAYYSATANDRAGITLVFSNNTISSQQAADQLMAQVVDKLRRNAGLKI